MSVTCRTFCRTLSTVFSVSLLVLILSLALMEVVVSPLMTFKYYTPSMWRGALADLSVTVFYAVCIAIQAINCLASVVLFASLLLTGYSERGSLCAYDTLTLASVALSGSLLAHRAQTGVDLYERRVERDIYFEVAKIGDQRCTSVRRSPFAPAHHQTNQCSVTDVFVWHQSSQCCGWRDAAELLPLFPRSGDHQLPQFCCLPPHVQPTVAGNWTADVAHLSGKSSQPQKCRLHSVNRFAAVCRPNRTSLFNLRSLSVVGHPCNVRYTVLKLFLALSYVFIKRQSFIPQGEGLYSYYLTP